MEGGCERWRIHTNIKNGEMLVRISFLHLFKTATSIIFVVITGEKIQYVAVNWYTWVRV